MYLNIGDVKINILFLAGAVIFAVSLLIFILSLLGKKKHLDRKLREKDPSVGDGIARANKEKKKQARKKLQAPEGYEPSPEPQYDSDEEPYEEDEEVLELREVKDWQKELLIVGLKSASELEEDEANKFIYQSYIEEIEKMSNWNINTLLEVFKFAPAHISQAILLEAADPESYYYTPDFFEEGEPFDYDEMDWAGIATTIDILNNDAEKGKNGWFDGFYEEWNPSGSFNRETALKYGQLQKVLGLLYDAVADAQANDDEVLPMGVTENMVDLNLKDIDFAIDYIRDGKELELMDAKTKEIVILAIVASVVNSISSSLMEGTSSNLTKEETSLVRLLAEISEKKPYQKILLEIDSDEEDDEEE